MATQTTTQAAGRRPPPRRPHVALLAMEAPRAAAELAGFAAFRPVLERAPMGDGHPVLVLPGLGGDDRSTMPMRGYLRRLGYAVHGWGLGTNTISRQLVMRLGDRFAELYERHDRQPISLVGWSLGGIYAREIARARPWTVRQVITLGSPFRESPGEESHPTAWIRAMYPNLPRRQLNQSALAVPSTAIFSRTDGIVPWRASRDVAAARTESVEVVSSHVGLGHHPGALWAIADRLAQPSGEWTPFKPPLALAALYPRRRRPTSGA